MFTKCSCHRPTPIITPSRIVLTVTSDVLPFFKFWLLPWSRDWQVISQSEWLTLLGESPRAPTQNTFVTSRTATGSHCKDHSSQKSFSSLLAVSPNSSSSIHDDSWISRQSCVYYHIFQSGINWRLRNWSLCTSPSSKFIATSLHDFPWFIRWFLTELGSVCLSLRWTRNELAAARNSPHFSWEFLLQHKKW